MGSLRKFGRQFTSEGQKKSRLKYNNRKVKLDGHTFDSQAEADYYLRLRAAARSGSIKDLEVQPRFTFEHRGRVLRYPPLWVVRSGKRFQRQGAPIRYYADFRFYDVIEKRSRVVDVKGMDTPVSKLKRALVLWWHGIDVEIVKKRKGRSS